VDDAEKLELDQLNLDQSATVIWDGPTQKITTLSKAVTYVSENITETNAMDPLIAISESPFLLETEQVQYLYEARLSTEEASSPSSD